MLFSILAEGDAMNVPVEWVLGIFALLGGCITTLAGIIYKTLLSRLKAQDMIIKNLQDDIDRLSKGGGIDSCLWRNR